MGNNFQYDGNGNMTSDGKWNFTWTSENMPSTISTTTNGNSYVTFAYDGNNERVQKGSTVYIGKYYQCTSGVCSKNIFAGDTRVAMKTGAATLYYHPDHLGSTLAVTDDSGTPEENNAYYPFGDFVSKSTLQPYEYTSQELDLDTGLYNYHARMYEPALGRFISPDPIVNYTNPQSLNRYAYVANNPINGSDPSGLLDVNWFNPILDSVQYTGANNTLSPAGTYTIGAHGSPIWIYDQSGHPISAATLWDRIAPDLANRTNVDTIILCGCNLAVSPGDGRLSFGERFAQIAKAHGLSVFAPNAFAWYETSGGIDSAWFADPSITWKNVPSNYDDLPEGNISTWTDWDATGNVNREAPNPGLAPQPGFWKSLKNWLNNLWSSSDIGTLYFSGTMPASSEYMFSTISPSANMTPDFYNDFMSNILGE